MWAGAPDAGRERADGLFDGELRRRRDPGLTHQVERLDPGSPGQRMVQGHRHVQGLADQQRRAQVGSRRRLGVVGAVRDDEVVVDDQLGEGVRGHVLVVRLQDQVGVDRQPLDQSRHEELAGGEEGGEPDGASGPAQEVVPGGIGLRQGGRDPAGARRQRPAGVSQPQPTAHRLDQRHPRVPLDRLELLGHRRRGPVGGRRDRRDRVRGRPAPGSARAVPIPTPCRSSVAPAVC